MNRFVYFLMVGFAFVALQVATVEAQGPACDPNPACDPSDPAGNCCPTCDPNPACVMDDPSAKPCCTGGNDGMAPPMCPGPLGTMIPCPAPGDGGPPPCPEGTVCDDPCISLETQALKDACHAEHSDEHGQVDCADPAHAAMPACTGG